MEADIQVAEGLHTALLNALPAAPMLVGGNHLAKLGAPVAQVVDAHGAVAQKVVDALEAVADGSGGQVTDVKALGDVDGGVVQAHRLALPFEACAPAAGVGLHGCQHALGQPEAVDEQVEVAALDLGAVNGRGLDAPGQLLGNLGRAHAQRLGQRKAGERHVPHGGIGRQLQRAANGRRIQLPLREGSLGRLPYRLCQHPAQLHALTLLVKRCSS